MCVCVCVCVCVCFGVDRESVNYTMHKVGVLDV